MRTPCTSVLREGYWFEIEIEVKIERERERELIGQKQNGDIRDRWNKQYPSVMMGIKFP